jgi:hypothetical protein
MNNLNITFDDAEFDRIVHGENTLRDDGQFRVVVKDNGTVQGNAIAVITFGVEVDGKIMRAQTVTTVKLLKGLLAILDGRYTDSGKKRT